MNQLKLLRVAFYFIISIANYFTAQAQEINEDDFTLYNKEKGLSGNTITGILQDSIGYIWIATSSGLNKFNGTAFEQFHSNNESWSLPSEHINGILWANKNKLVSFGDGLHLINTRDGHTSNIFIPYSDKQYQYKYNWIISVSSNSIGDLFVLARSGFYQINAQGQIIFRFEYYKENEVAAASFSFGRYLIALGENKYAIVSESGIYYYNSKLKLIKKMSPEDYPAFSEFLDYSKSRDQFYQVKEGTFIVLSGLGNDGYYVDLIKHIKIHFKVPFSNVEQEFDYRSSLIPLNDTTFFINGKATGFYLLKLDQQKSTVDFNPYKFFKDNSCRYVLMDKEKTLWIGTTRGLFHQTRSRHFITQTPIPSFIENRYPNLIVKDICIVGDKICAATRSYAGLLIFDKKFRFIRRIGLENCWRKPDIIYALTSLNNEETLLATNGPLFKVNIKTGVIKEFNLPDWDRNNDWIADLNKDQKGNIWISSSELYKYDVSKNLVTAIKDWKTYRDKIVWSQRIGKDDSGNIWLAGHGLIRYNATSESFDKFINTFPFIKVPDKQVNSFKADHLNNIWINANNNGLICYNTITNSFRTFTTNDGLPDNNITNMIVVKNKLWLSTFSGIACIDLRSFQIKSFGADDGFPEESLTIGTKFFYDEENNKVLIGFKNKIIQFDPDIISEKSQPPKLFIQSLSFENKNKILFPQDNFTTSWRNKDITISIGTINYSTGSTQRFAYKLDEDTTEIWHWLGSNNTFSISNLSSGQHSIQVKLYSAANRWPDQVKRFNIMLSPPYWQETWFQVICIYIIILTLFFLYRWQTGLIQKKERAKTALEQLKAEEYKSQYELEQISNYFSSTLADKHNVDDVLWDV
jgi:ligand-binding sensor domain-containing protein